ncbi:hypothetical protein [Psychrobacter sp. ENNN9_III]|nr:hypothetical protein [Psychrobacter sp. ENNN9_III]OLF38101.1 hypothetical protein BTV98_04445 [Psychrobacter sp. Cmf 22.2]
MIYESPDSGLFVASSTNFMVILASSEATSSVGPVSVFFSTSVTFGFSTLMTGSCSVWGFGLSSCLLVSGVVDAS